MTKYFIDFQKAALRGPVVGLALTMLPTNVKALDIKMQQVANAIAEIASNEKECGYVIDEARMEAYYSKSGLATPEGLALITNVILFKSQDMKPTKTECVLARTTARSMGVLADN